MFKGVFCLFLFSGSLLVAQAINGQAVVGIGYGAPVTPISAAPGEIVTLFVTGIINPVVTSVTVALQQNNSVINFGTEVSTPAPVLSSSLFSVCPDSVTPVELTCGDLAAVTVQIPYELIAYCLTCAGAPDATLAVSQNGKLVSAIELNPIPDHVHVLPACGSDTFNLTGLPCPPAVTHANGEVVSIFHPAQPGEALTAWIYGLGQTTPSAVTGQPAVEASATDIITLDFNYRVNALATKPYTGEPSAPPTRPRYAGSAPGYIGLYQVNFVVPPLPTNGIPRCTGIPTGTAYVQSNLTVSIGGQYSFDGAGICVATQPPAD